MMPIQTLTIGNKIRIYRTRKGMSIEELANELDVSRQIVSKWEHEKSIPRFDTAIKIANLLGIDLNDLKPGKDEFSITDAINLVNLSE